MDAINGTEILAVPAARLNARLQQCSDLLAYCLRALDAYRPTNVRRVPHGALFAWGEGVEAFMPGVEYDVMIGPPIPLDRLQPWSKSWALRHGAAELITIVSQFILEARAAGTIVKLGASQGGKVSLEQLEEAGKTATPEALKFDKGGLPKKLRELRAYCGIKADQVLEDLEARVITINDARVCLEHRGGGVTAEDENSGDPPGLRVDWVEFSVTIGDLKGENERPLREAAHSVGGQVHIRQQAKRTRFFERGHPIVFTAHEFVGLCWTVSKYGERFTEKLLEAAREQVSSKS